MGLSQGKFIVNHEDKEAVKVETNGDVTQETVKDVSINIKESAEAGDDKAQPVKEKCKKKKNIRVWVKKRFSDCKEKKSLGKKETLNKDEVKDIITEESKKGEAEVEKTENSDKKEEKSAEEQKTVEEVKKEEATSDEAKVDKEEEVEKKDE